VRPSFPLRARTPRTDPDFRPRNSRPPQLLPGAAAVPAQPVQPARAPQLDAALCPARRAARQDRARRRLPREGVRPLSCSLSLSFARESKPDALHVRSSSYYAMQQLTVRARRLVHERETAALTLLPLARSRARRRTASTTRPSACSPGSERRCVLVLPFAPSTSSR